MPVKFGSTDFLTTEGFDLLSLLPREVEWAEVPGKLNTSSFMTNYIQNNLPWGRPKHDFLDPSQIHLGYIESEFPTHGAYSLNTLIWPTSASKFGIFQGLMDSSRVYALEMEDTLDMWSLTDSTDDSGARIQDESDHIKANMFFLHAQAIAVGASDLQDDELYVVTLVDERYMWQKRRLTTPTFKTYQGNEQATPTRWTDLIESIATELNITISYDTISESTYLYPHQDIYSHYRYAPQVLDAIARSIGCYFVAEIGATENYKLKTVTQSNTDDVTLFTQVLNQRRSGSTRDPIASASGDRFNIAYPDYFYMECKQRDYTTHPDNRYTVIVEPSDLTTGTPKVRGNNETFSYYNTACAWFDNEESTEAGNQQTLRKLAKELTWLLMNQMRNENYSVNDLYSFDLPGFNNYYFWELSHKDVKCGFTSCYQPTRLEFFNKDSWVDYPQWPILISITDYDEDRHSYGWEEVQLISGSNFGWVKPARGYDIGFSDYSAHEINSAVVCGRSTDLGSELVTRLYYVTYEDQLRYYFSKPAPSMYLVSGGTIPAATDARTPGQAELRIQRMDYHTYPIQETPVSPLHDRTVYNISTSREVDLSNKVGLAMEDNAGNLWLIVEPC